MKTLIVFAKAPVEGRVKTRLKEGTPLGDGQILELYRAFLNDVLTIATMTCAEAIAVHYAPETEGDAMKKIVKKLHFGARNEARFMFAPQEGGAFTERIVNSFRQAADMGGTELVMIGSDSPLIRPQLIDEAFEFVYSRTGMALGPSGEGGAYLIGLPSDFHMDFDGVFTEGSELENLLAKAKEGNLPLKVLPETLDVDVAADLIGLAGIIRAKAYERKFCGDFFPAHTAKAIDELGLRVGREEGGTRGKVIEIGNDE